MQNKVLLGKFYQIKKIDQTEYSRHLFERLEKIRLYTKLCAEGCSQDTALVAIKASRATIYRWIREYEMFGLMGLEPKSKRPLKLRKSQWTDKAELIVLDMRRKYKIYGKCKLAVLIKQEQGVNLSTSTIGRILKKLVSQGKLQAVSCHLMGTFTKQPRLFTSHAKRWKYGMRSASPGELIQIDHMTINHQGMLLKHFTAVCLTTKITIHQVYRSATSTIAAEFLRYLQSQIVTPIRSIQVDGGSEFMGAFEKACEEAQIPLYVLPPRRPTYNAHVERGNRTVKYEFYYQYSGPMKLELIRKSLNVYTKNYNTLRPHQGIGHLTPYTYYSQLTQVVILSQMYLTSPEPCF